MKNQKNEKGSVTLFVLIAMLFFLFIAIGIFISVQNRETNQEKETERIKQSYEKNIDQIDDVYYSHFGEEYTKEGYIKSGLVLQYDGINNTGEGHSNQAERWKDLSGNGNDGKLMGFTDTKWSEKSLVNNNSSYVLVDSLTDVHYDNMTIEISAKSATDFPNDNPTRVWRCLISKVTGGFARQQEYFIDWYGSSGERILRFDEGYQSNDTSRHLFSEYNMKNYISHLSYTFGNDDSIAYINGERMSTKSQAPDNPLSAPVIIGNGFSNGFIGDIYSVRIYNRILTQEEVSQNYQIDKKRFDEQKYVQEGLMLHLDGIQNTENGHSNTATTWKDLSGNGNDGQLRGVDYNSESGWQEDGMKFDGIDSSVTVGDANTFKFDGDFTVEVPHIYTDKGNYAVLSKWSGAGSSNALWIGAYQNKIAFGNYAKDITSQIFYYAKEYGKVQTTVKRHGNLLQYYINGQKKGEIQFSYSMLNEKLLTIGMYSHEGTSWQYNGVVNGVRIYNRALTDNEIFYNYKLDETRYHF